MESKFLQGDFLSNLWPYWIANEEVSFSLYFMILSFLKNTWVGDYSVSLIVKFSVPIHYIRETCAIPLLAAEEILACIDFIFQIRTYHIRYAQSGTVGKSKIQYCRETTMFWREYLFLHRHSLPWRLKNTENWICLNFNNCYICDDLILYEK